MVKKRFFQERTVQEIARHSNLVTVDAWARLLREDGRIIDSGGGVVPIGDEGGYHTNGLTCLLQRVLEDPFRRAVVLGNSNRSVVLAPERFSRDGGSTRDARKFYKHGYFLPLAQPRTFGDALHSYKSLLAMRREAFSELGINYGDEKIPEEELFVLGYSYWPVMGTRVKIKIPFDVLVPGLRIRKYAAMATEEEARTKDHRGFFPSPIGIRAFHDAARVASEGAVVHFRTPSREKGRRPSRYEGQIVNVPIWSNGNQFAIGLSTRPRWEEGKIPGDEMWNFGYKFEGQRERSDSVTWGSHSVAAAYALQKTIHDELGTFAPFEGSPIANVSEEFARLDGVIRNNVIIYDPNIRARNKLRKLRRSEICTLLGRAIAELGHERTLYWDALGGKKMVAYDLDVPGGLERKSFHR